MRKRIKRNQPNDFSFYILIILSAKTLFLIHIHWNLHLLQITKISSQDCVVSRISCIDF